MALSQLLQISISFDGSLGTRTGSYNTLTIDWVSYIACRKHSRKIGTGSTWNHLDETLFIQIDDTLEKIGVRLMTDSQEETINCDIKLLLVSLSHVANQMSTLHTIITKESEGIGLEKNLDVFLVLYTLLHDF